MWEWSLWIAVIQIENLYNYTQIKYFKNRYWDVREMWLISQLQLADLTILGLNF